MMLILNDVNFDLRELSDAMIALLLPLAGAGWLAAALVGVEQ
jgi:hypothetical protein